MNLASVSVGARIAAIASHLPDERLDNAMLADVFQTWTADKILEKTGIRERRVASPDETALDLGAAAAERLFVEQQIAREDVDFLIFCSQAPDYILPSSACILQDRLGLRRSVGALDINLGCSGFVYGLSIAAGLIAAGSATSVLLVTADTYSKFIHPQDRSVRTLFGDGAAATLIVADDTGASIGPFVFGTDGSGAKSLIVEAGAARLPRSEETGGDAEDAFGNIRSRDNLYMDGSAVLNFTLREVPRTWAALKERAGLDNDQVEYVVLHQANRFMLDALVKKLNLPRDKVPYMFEDTGNTVSSTIPFVLEDLMARKAIAIGDKIGLLGFGVGLSWAGGIIQF